MPRTKGTSATKASSTAGPKRDTKSPGKRVTKQSSGPATIVQDQPETAAEHESHARTQVEAQKRGAMDTGGPVGYQGQPMPDKGGSDDNGPAPGEMYGKEHDSNQKQVNKIEREGNAARKTDAAAAGRTVLGTYTDNEMHNFWKQSQKDKK